MVKPGQSFPAHAKEAGFLEAQVAELALVFHKGFSFDEGGANFGVLVFRVEINEFPAADGVNAGLETRDAAEAPFGVGERLYQGVFFAAGGVMPIDQGLDERSIGGDLVGGEQDGWAGEGGPNGVMGGLGLNGLGFGTRGKLALGAIGVDFDNNSHVGEVPLPWYGRLSSSRKPYFSK